MNRIDAFDIANTVGNVLHKQKENTRLDEILKQSMASNDPNVQNDVLRQILTNVSPERRPEALQAIQTHQQQLAQQRQRSAIQQEGINPDLPANVIAQKAKQMGGAGKLNPEAQKWAYKELEKKAPIQALKSSIAELRRKNEAGVTGPVAGTIPSIFASKEADAIRKGIDIDAVQLLNVHKSMFPRGLTQGEFKDLGAKVVSSKNTQVANKVILDSYERLADLQEAKLNAVQQAVQQYGFDPMLPFMISGIQKQFDDQEEQENRKLYEQVMGKKPKEGKSNETSSIKLRLKQTGQIAEVPVDKFESLSDQDKQLYERVE
jgi:hypothetical protein